MIPESPLCGSPLRGSSHKIYNSGTFGGIVIKCRCLRASSRHLRKSEEYQNAERQFGVIGVTGVIAISPADGGTFIYYLLLVT
jgi:hypothetical protein